MIQRFVPDVLLAGGVLAIVYGISRYSVALASVTLGVLLVWFALALAHAAREADLVMRRRPDEYEQR